MRPGRGWAPRLAVRRVSDIPLDLLVGAGVRAVLFDLDNTLVPYGSQEIPGDLCGWLESFRARGLRAAVVSNAWPWRARRVAERLGWPAVAGWPKPSLSRLRKAMALLGSTPATTALVGDQLFTDIWPANRLGLFTVLVEPLVPREFVTTRLARWLERLAGRRALEERASSRSPGDRG
ncbi:MAG: YqeG family HAD IIIA-type phosphatase [Armatimonadota bacterium]|nr:YqeG family HAD IIIA-type phosphatase [Armatimonadota bacterium]